MPKLALSRRHRRHGNLSELLSTSSPAFEGGNSSERQQQQHHEEQSDCMSHSSNSNSISNTATALHFAAPRKVSEEDITSDETRIGDAPASPCLKRPSPSLCLRGLVSQNSNSLDTQTIDDVDDENRCLTPNSPWGHFVDLFVPSSDEAITSHERLCSGGSTFSFSPIDEPYPRAVTKRRRIKSPAGQFLNVQPQHCQQTTPTQQHHHHASISTILTPRSAIVSKYCNEQQQLMMAPTQVQTSQTMIDLHSSLDGFILGSPSTCVSTDVLIESANDAIQKLCVNN